MIQRWWNGLSRLFGQSVEVKPSMPFNPWIPVEKPPRARRRTSTGMISRFCSNRYAMQKASRKRNRAIL